MPISDRAIALALYALLVAALPARSEVSSAAWDGASIELRQPVMHATAGTASEVARIFADHGLLPDKVIASGTAPRLYVKDVPTGFDAMPLHRKEETFISLVLPNVLRINERIARQRAKLVAFRVAAGQGGLSAADRSWLEALARSYQLPGEDLEQLLNRVDLLPPSLAIAQAIEESGWGTSRFALEGNALFGEHMPTGEAGRYLSATGSDARVMAFNSVLDGVAAYLHNINISSAYRQLRQKRASLQGRHGAVAGGELAQGLVHYSARDEVYVRMLRELIDRHQLDKLDRVTLCRDCGALLVIP